MTRPVGVWVTRPQAQAEGICQRIQALGWQAFAYPLLEIVPLTLAQPPALVPVDLLVFISRNAVTYALAQMDLSQFHGRVAAVGKATAQALAEAAIPVDILPERADSEGLLSHPDLADLTGKKVLILRGVGGRELLAETLTERGAQVTYAEVYRRRLPDIDLNGLLSQWSKLDLVLITSGEILDNLYQSLGDQASALLAEVTLVVVSERLRQQALARGLSRFILAEGASDRALISAMLDRAGNANL